MFLPFQARLYIIIISTVHVRTVAYKLSGMVVWLLFSSTVLKLVGGFNPDY